MQRQSSFRNILPGNFWKTLECAVDNAILQMVVDNALRSQLPKDMFGSKTPTCPYLSSLGLGACPNDQGLQGNLEKKATAIEGDRL